MGSVIRRAGHRRAGRLENPPSTQMNASKPSPCSRYLYSQPNSQGGRGRGERGRQSPASPGGDPPRERARGYETAENPQGLGSCPHGCVLQQRDGRGLPRLPPPRHPRLLQRHCPGVPLLPSPAPLRAWRWHGRGGFHVLELSGSMCRRPWGGQGFPGSPAVRRAGGVPEPDGFPAVPAASPGLASPPKRAGPCSARRPRQRERCLPGTWHGVPRPVPPEGTRGQSGSAHR